MFLIAHQQRIGHMFHSIEARHRLLQQCLFAQKTEKLLGILLARKRPQACSGAAGQDNGVNFHVLCQRKKEKKELTLTQAMPWYDLYHSTKRLIPCSTEVRGRKPTSFPRLSTLAEVAGTSPSCIGSISSLAFFPRHFSSTSM